MSKRRSKKPNLPDDVLARARKQAGVEEPEPETVENDTDDESEAEVDGGNGESISINERAARRRKLTPVQVERSRKRGELDADTIRDMLENPTVIVPESQLREEYQHVLVDLRNMGVLAAALMVLLVVLAQFI